MPKRIKSNFATLMILALGLQFFSAGITPVSAANLADVVINELAWAGSNDSANDEWIELYNNGSQTVDLQNWVIERNGVASYTLSGNIAAHGYFLIERNENAVSNVSADQIISISLANTGNSLVLKDATGNMIDTVNGSAGAWYAGDSTSKATMERIDPELKSDVASNWATASSGNGSKSSNNSTILGTPRGSNSNYAGSGAAVHFDAAEINTDGTTNINLPVYVDSVSDLYAYGFEIDYPTNLLSFVSAQEDSFLNSDGSSTAFNAALKNGAEGSLIVGNARLLNPAKGLDGSGKLFDLTFKVLGTGGATGSVIFAGNSFLSDSKANIPVKLTASKITIGSGAVDGPTDISNLQIAPGDQRYSLKLSWQADQSVDDSFIVERQMADKSFVTIGTVKTTSFVDDDTVTMGGKLIPGIIYQYRVSPVKNNVKGKSLMASDQDTRGLVGDNDRSDMVDGKDIENLARAYGSVSGDGSYNSLADTNFDGIIDGKDLIDIGVNFGLSYQI